MPVVRQFLAGVRALLVLTVVLGLAYPLAMTGIGQLLFHDHANGSVVSVDGRAVGSTRLGQSFIGSRWFHPRPSAAGPAGYDALASGGSNLGPSSPQLAANITRARAAAAAANGVAARSVPPDAVTASASGLDPDISPPYAYEQVDRVARVRGLEPGVLRRLVAAQVTGRTLGFLGEPRVNVLELNLALDRLTRGAG